jgi:phosphonate transport system substrate-binding protein
MRPGGGYNFPMTEAAPPSPAAPRHVRTNPLLLVGLPILAVALAGLALYIALVQAPTRANQRESQDLLLALTGLKQPVSNKLAAGFTDANNDLVADPPTDAAKLLDPPTLLLSYVATDDAETYQAAFKEFGDHLAKVTGRKVEYVLLRSPEDQLLALRDGKLHVTAFNTGNVPRAVNSVGFVPVAMPATAEGDPFIRSVVLVAPAVAAAELVDLKGSDITLTDPFSNSGFRVPLVMLKNAGLLPVRDYNIRYSGGHSDSITRLNNAEASIVFVASDILARDLARGSLVAERYRKLAESEKFPSAAMGYAHNLSPDLAAKVREAILSFPWAGTGLEKALGPGGSARFVPVNFKDDYALVRRIDDDTGVLHKLQP